jgi:hypothetical protein
MGATCGEPSDGCGALLDCGTCASPAVCGGGGVPFACACPTGTWTTQVVTNGQSTGLSSAVVVTGGTTRVIFSGGYAASATGNGLAGWQTYTPFTATGAILGIAAASARDGTVHYAYTAQNQNQFLWLDSTNLVDVVDEGAAVLQATPGIAVDSAGGIHFAYASCADNEEHYLFFAPGSTTPQSAVVWQLATCETNSAIAVDGQGGVHLAWTSPAGLSVAYRAPGLSSWSVSSPDARATGGAVALAADAAGTTYVAYGALGTRVGVAPPGGSFSFSTVDDHQEWNVSPSALAVSGGRGHVAFVAGADASGYYHVNVADFDASGATVQTVYSSKSPMSGASIGIDANGGLRVAFTVNSQGLVGSGYYAYRCP